MLDTPADLAFFKLNIKLRNLLITELLPTFGYPIKPTETAYFTPSFLE